MANGDVLICPLLAMKPWNRIAGTNLFNLARVAYGTVVWPGEIDIVSETPV